ncbi:MAG: hypothetical protein IBX57_00765 [Gammaproteobacteria bacterium]|nr:hypothetical protein [Gammaproteobacteria bacterium]
MDKVLADLVATQVPSINPIIAEGLATHEMKFVEQYVDRILRSGQDDFPEGLRYVQYRRLTPLEEYLRLTDTSGSKSYYDIARSDVYMINLEFDFKGEKINKPLYLPYVRDGGVISLRGSCFAVSPVLCDKGLSMSTDSTFVQIPKAKMTFKKIRQHFIADGQRRSPNVIYSWLHNRNRKNNKQAGKPLVTMNTTLVHYLFCKYGLKETFSMFNGSEIKVGYEDTINSTELSSEWVICQSIGNKPRGVRSNAYKASNIRLAIRECDFDPITESMIASFFYVVDHFPERLLPEYLDGSKYEVRLWRILLGHAIGGVTGGEGSIAESVDEHMESLDSYIDARAKRDLANGDIYVDNLYQLLYYLVELLSGMTTMSTDSVSTMYNKILVVLRYVLNDINESVFRLIFRLRKTAGKKELTFNDVNKMIRSHLPTDAVFKMNGARHGEVTSISSPGDNKFFKITSNILLQTDSGGGIRGSKSTKIDKSKFLHASIAEVGSFTVLPKSEPTGRSRINPWVQLNEDGTIERDPSKVDIIEQTQVMIQRD